MLRAQKCGRPHLRCRREASFYQVSEWVLQNVSKFSLKLQFCSRSYSDVQNVEEEDPLLALQLYKLVSFLQSKANEREVEVSE